MTDTKMEIILIHETMWQSVISDTYTFASIIAVIGTGWWLGSSAMQWAGFVILSLGLLAWRKNRPRLTPQEAAEHLHQTFGVRAK